LVLEYDLINKVFHLSRVVQIVDTRAASSSDGFQFNLAETDFTSFRFPISDKDPPECDVRVEKDEKVEAGEDVVHEVLKRKQFFFVYLVEILSQIIFWAFFRD
jgi:hypothetical protein